MISHNAEHGFTPHLSGRAFDVMHIRETDHHDERERSGSVRMIDAAGEGVARFFEMQAPSGKGEGGIKELLSRAFGFRLSDLLRLRTFLYLLPVTGILLFQIYNTIAIQKLALANETLREQIAMSSSVITSQELKVNELQGIHNIALQAEFLGLQASSVPAVEIVP